MDIKFPVNSHEDVDRCVDKLVEFNKKLISIHDNLYTDTVYIECAIFSIIVNVIFLIIMSNYLDCSIATGLGFAFISCLTIFIFAAVACNDYNGIIGSHKNKKNNLSELDKLLEINSENIKKLKDIATVIKTANDIQSFTELYDDYDVSIKKKEKSESYSMVFTAKAIKEYINGKNPVNIPGNDYSITMSREDYDKTVKKDCIDFSWLDGDLIKQTQETYGSTKDICLLLSDKVKVDDQEVKGFLEYNPNNNDIE